MERRVALRRCGVPARRRYWLPALALALCSMQPSAQPVLSDAGVLPRGSHIETLPTRAPRQILKATQHGGRQSYLVAIGNMAFSAPALLGGTARKAGISCESCHTNGDINRRFFIPGVSDRPGNADVTHSLFNPEGDDGVRNPINIPSLRGVRFTAPYGHDGRFSSLRAFTRNVIVNEFAGAEPSPLILDALVAYMRQIQFLPTPEMEPSGRLTAQASEAAHRGEALFHRSFPGMGGRSCASCHLPSAQFTDGEQYNVGTGQAYETPTLRNIVYTAPYFARGQAGTLAEVIAHFDTFYSLDLSAREQSDLLTYLNAIGSGRRPIVALTFERDLAELLVFAATLPHSLETHRADLVRLTVDTVNAELRDIRERWPDPASRETRAIVANWVLQLRQVDLLSQNDHWQQALAAYQRWQGVVARQRAQVAQAMPESLYRKDNRAAYLKRFDVMLAHGKAPRR